MLELRSPTLSDELAFRAAVAEFKLHDPEWHFAFHFTEATDFSAYVERVRNQTKGKDLGDFVSNTYLIAVVGNKVVGRVSLRHELNAFLSKKGGHIGYGVVPSERRRGYAKEILRQTLPIAKELGLTRVLLTCDDDNIASARTIERNGGILEGIVSDESESPAVFRRYWINL